MTWQCIKCEVQNHDLVKLCEVCDLPKDLAQHELLLKRDRSGFVFFVVCLIVVIFLLIVVILLIWKNNSLSDKEVAKNAPATPEVLITVTHTPTPKTTSAQAPPLVTYPNNHVVY